MNDDHWPDQLPARWRWMRMKHVARLKSGESISSDAIKESGEYPVYGGNGLRGYTNAYTHSGNHALIGRQGALCGNINYASGRFWASEHAVVVSIQGEHQVLWLGELLRCMNLNRYSQSAAQPGLSVDFIASLRIPVPPPDVQASMVRYIEQQLARIDEPLRAKERFLEMLAEKRRAVIAQAVTRGIDPDAPMRDSGIEWLGSIPAHWDTERARWLLDERDERSDTGEEELLSVSHITGVTARSEKDVTMFEAETTEGYKRCSPGDLVINTLWAWMGAMGVTPITGIVSPAYNVYVPSARLLPAYIDALVRIPAFAQEVTRYSKGVWSSRLRLYPEGFFQVHLPVPPVDEQQAIVDHLGAETSAIDELTKATASTIELLKERRSALITSVVTGETPVP